MPSTLSEVQALIGRLEAVAAEHELEVEIQRVAEGASRGWYAAIYGEAGAGLGGGSTVGEAIRGALASTALSNGGAGGHAAS